MEQTSCFFCDVFSEKVRALFDSERFFVMADDFPVNSGEAAGQTVSHLHIHVILRYTGDVEQPRGGIRNFKKPLVEYL